MIHVLGWRFYAFIILVPVVLISALLFAIQPVQSVDEFFLLFAKSGIIVAVVTALMSNSSMFSLVSKFTPLRWLVPHIHGKWAGQVTTNYFDKAKKMGLEAKPDGAPPTSQIAVTVEILVNLFTVTIRLESTSGYLTSETKACQLRKAGEGGFELAYVTVNTVVHPEETDEQSFSGAGLIRFQSKSPEALRGTQWTNRNWQKCLNTAGTITLDRAS